MADVNKDFDVTVFLAKPGIGKKIVSFRKNSTIFTQGDDCQEVYYIHAGSVKLSVLSPQGKEAAVAILNPGDFVGEECLTDGSMSRSSCATALTDATLLRIERLEMVRALKDESLLSVHFVNYLLRRAARVQADLIDQLFNSSEKRLARILLLLAHFGEPGAPEVLIPKISQETLAQMIGCTRSRVSLFLNRFRQLGYIDYGEQIKVNNSLLQIVLRD